MKMNKSEDIVITAAKRTACGKANKGSLRFTRPDSLMGTVIKDLLRFSPAITPDMIDDVVVGCAFPEATQGMNMARQAVFLGGLPDSVPGITINRFCSSGLQAIAIAANCIAAGSADIIIAGGAESMSQVPMGGISFQPNPKLVQARPEVYINMGLTAENVAKTYNINRTEQDEFALKSHEKAITAWRNGTFKEQITPVEVSRKYVTAAGDVAEEIFIFQKDEGPREDANLQALAGLRPVFKNGGTVTAGNSSQMNDAAAGVLLMKRKKADELGLTPIAKYHGFAVAGVAPEFMGIGPVEAIPRVLDKTGLQLDDIDLIELNEAFAAQALAVINQAKLDADKVNVNGGGIAMGHPLGCTGAKLATQLIYDLHRLDKQFGMVTMCIGGGMGAGGIFERI